MPHIAFVSDDEVEPALPSRGEVKGTKRPTLKMICPMGRKLGRLRCVQKLLVELSVRIRAGKMTEEDAVEVEMALEHWLQGSQRFSKWR